MLASRSLFNFYDQRSIQHPTFLLHLALDTLTKSVRSANVIIEYFPGPLLRINVSVSVSAQKVHSKKRSHVRRRRRRHLIGRSSSSLHGIAQVTANDAHSLLQRPIYPDRYNGPALFRPNFLIGDTA
jgi:hypothetical protein